MATATARRAKRMLPSEPLLAIVERRWGQEKAQGGRSFSQFTADCGVGERQVRLWREASIAGEFIGVEAWTADRVLCRLELNWFDVFDEVLYPDAYRAAARVFG